jgi:hypothetical protein
MKTPLCPLYPRADRRVGWVIALCLLGGAALLTACALLPVTALVEAEDRGGLYLDVLARSRALVRDIGPLAPLCVEINERGWAFVSGRRVSPPALRELVRQVVRVYPEQKVVFRSSLDVPARFLAPFFDACASEGIRHVYFIAPGS